MIDLNDPLTWNILLAAGAGAGIATAQRFVAKYSGNWVFYRNNWPTKKIDLVERISSKIREPVEQMGAITYEGTIDSRGYVFDEDLLMESYMMKQMRLPRNPKIFEQEAFIERPSIDYVVCFSITDTKNGSTIEPRVVAASIVEALLKDKSKKRVSSYAIGSSLVNIDESYVLSMLNIEKQNGFNLFSAIRDINNERYKNPTYMIFVVNGSSEITDEKKEIEARDALIHNARVLPVFIELGRPHLNTVRRFAQNNNALYFNIKSGYGGIDRELSDKLSDATSAMREKVA